MTELSIEYVPLSEVVVWTHNPKKHVVEDIVASVAAVGYVDPLIVDDRTKVLTAGHGRVEALKSMKDAGKPVPDGVHAREDGEWLVPVLRGVSFNSDTEMAAFAVAENRLCEKGGVDTALLGPLLNVLRAGGALAGTGYVDKDVLKMLKASGGGPLPEPKEFDESVADGLELRSRWTVTFPAEARPAVEAAVDALAKVIPGLKAEFE